MKFVKKLLEQHREEGRFKPVIPHTVQNTPGVSPRDTFSQNVRKHRKMKFDIHKEDTEMKEENKMKGPDPCWKGYKMIGKKTKNGREVPNCVPVKNEEVEQMVEYEQFSKPKTEKVVTIKHKTSGKELSVVHTAVPKYQKLGYELVKEGKNPFERKSTNFQTGDGVPEPRSRGVKKEEIEVVDEMAGANMDVRQIHKHLKKSGWDLTRTSGGHDVYTHPKSTEHIAVPRHKHLKAPLVLGILKTAKKVTEEVDENPMEVPKKVPGLNKLKEAKTASIARGILMRKLDTMKLIKTPKPVQPKEPEKPAQPKMTTEELSRKAQIVKNAAKKKEKFIADPVITQTYVKTENS
jgi:predicted RNA binding protein YcfA (HicA-like mRNA interferase family)